MSQLTLSAGGVSLIGWTRVRVTRSAERCPSHFQIGMTDLDALPVREGQACEVHLDGDLVITGYVDRVMASLTPRGHDIEVIGRSKCGDLVDCSAEWPGSQIVNSTALGIAQKLARPYGITVRGGVPITKIVPLIVVNQGEPAFDLIETVCRYSALLAYDEPDGNLLLTTVGKVRASSGAVEGENVQEAHGMQSMDQRYSEYQVLRQSVDQVSDLGHGGNLLSSQPDPSVTRHRRKVIICEAVGGGSDVSIKRAKWEAGRRFGRSYSARVTVDSWRDSAGNLWEPNTLVPLHLPSLKIKDVEWVVGEVTFSLDESGTKADLLLMPPQAFDPEPILLQPVDADIPHLPVRNAR